MQCAPQPAVHSARLSTYKWRALYLKYRAPHATCTHNQDGTVHAALGSSGFCVVCNFWRCDLPVVRGRMSRARVLFTSPSQKRLVLSAVWSLLAVLFYHYALKNWLDATPEIPALARAHARSGCAVCQCQLCICRGNRRLCREREADYTDGAGGLAHTKPEQCKCDHGFTSIWNASLLRTPLFATRAEAVQSQHCLATRVTAAPI